MEDILSKCMVENGLPILDNKIFDTYNLENEVKPYEPTNDDIFKDILIEMKLANYNFTYMRASLETIVEHNKTISKLMEDKRLIFVPEEMKVPVKFTTCDTLEIPKITIPKYKHNDTKEKRSRKRKHGESFNNEDSSINYVSNTKYPPIGKKNITMKAPRKH